MLGFFFVSADVRVFLLCFSFFHFLRVFQNTAVSYLSLGSFLQCGEVAGVKRKCVCLKG